MINSTSTLFISDIHLEKSQPEITRQFLKLLNEIRPPVDALYILGDLFEIWIGDDGGIPEHQEIIQALRSLTQNGVPVFVLHGNRDFLIGKKFLEETGCQFLPDESVISIYGQTVLLMHGDTLCTRDIVYIRMRKIIRHPLVQWLFLKLPLSIRLAIANKIREKSKQHTAVTSYDTMDVTQDEVRRIMQNHKASCLIHGHTHRPGFHQFTLQGTAAERIVLGAWHERGNVLVWGEMGRKEWKEL
jgi:UDP-2,3-diacylglucosamine hydrolase